MKRNPAIELYRCILMFGICLLHCLHRDSYGVWAESLLLPCVCGFAFISGWFGIRFTPSKVLRLYGVQFYCLAVAQIASWAGGNGFNVQSMFKGFCSFWFIHAYVLMMLFAPLVNHAVDDRRAVRVMVPFLVAVFGWGFLGRFPIVNRFVPKSIDLDMYSGLTLLGVYAVARLARIYAWMNGFRFGGWQYVSWRLPLFVPQDISAFTIRLLRLFISAAPSLWQVG